MSEYSKYTEAYILAHMLAQISSGIDISEGSATEATLSPFAIELAEGYINLDSVINLFFPQTTHGQYVDNWLATRGMDRKPGTAAIGAVTFTGTNGTVIPSGTKVQTAGGLLYDTTAVVTITGTTASVSVQAEAVGTAYNVAAGAINSIPIAVIGVSSVTNAASITGGVDVESDASAIARFLEDARNPSTSGNKYDYYGWAVSVSGIGDAKILPLWNGNGTVKVVLIDGNKQPASSALVTNVQAYTEGFRPIGATVTYESATGLSINVSATLLLASGYTVSGVQSAVQTSIASFLKSIAFSNNLSAVNQLDYVSYAKIGDAILNVPGVLDYSNLTVNGGTANVSVQIESVAVLGTVTLS